MLAHCWEGHGFHSFVCCSRSIWELSLDPAVVRTHLLHPTFVMHNDDAILGGAPIKDIDPA
jgi:hypothetical protein